MTSRPPLHLEIRRDEPSIAPLLTPEEVIWKRFAPGTRDLSGP